MTIYDDMLWKPSRQVVNADLFETVLPYHNDAILTWNHMINLGGDTLDICEFSLQIFVKLYLQSHLILNINLGKP